MRRLVIWFLAGLVTVFLTVLIFVPAAWMSAVVEAQTAGRLTLGDAQGTLSVSYTHLTLPTTERV